jgi:hypothetical protein
MASFRSITLVACLGTAILSSTAIAQSPPDVGSFSFGLVRPGETIDFTLPLLSGSPPVVWHDFELALFDPFGDGTGAHFDATFDYDTQLFHWDTYRSSLGWYYWSVQASNEFGSDSGTRSVFLITPEPTTLAISAIGMLGVACVRRHRR